MIDNNLHSNRFCLITGSANGLGFELAKIYAKNGYSLVLVDKDRRGLEKVEEEIKSTYNIEVLLIVEDLSAYRSALKVFDVLSKNNIKPEVLINNAGFGYFGFFSENDWDKKEDMINLSVLTTTHLTRLLLPDMIANKEGHIINISSLAAFTPGPLMSVYHASKAFILSFSQALSNELKRTGVNVTVVCPGMMATGFSKANANESPKLKWTIGSAEEVACICYKSMLKKKVVVIPGIMNKIAAGLSRIFPRKTTTTIVRKMQEKNRSETELAL